MLWVVDAGLGWGGCGGNLIGGVWGVGWVWVWGGGGGGGGVVRS